MRRRAEAWGPHCGLTSLGAHIHSQRPLRRHAHTGPVRAHLKRRVQGLHASALRQRLPVVLGHEGGKRVLPLLLLLLLPRPPHLPLQCAEPRALPRQGSVVQHIPQLGGAVSLAPLRPPHPLLLLRHAPQRLRLLQRRLAPALCLSLLLLKAASTRPLLLLQLAPACGLLLLQTATMGLLLGLQALVHGLNHLGCVRLLLLRLLLLLLLHEFLHEGAVFCHAALQLRSQP